MSYADEYIDRWEEAAWDELEELLELQEFREAFAEYVEEHQGTE